MVFVAHDVGDRNPPTVLFLHETDRDTRDGVDDRNACGHKAEGRAADGRHGARTVRFENIGDDAHCVGERFFIGHDRLDAAFGQSSVTIFATTDPAIRLTFADGVGGEVIVEHEALGIFVEEPFDALFVLGGSKGDGDERLGFAALEDRGTVDARKDVDATFDRTHFFDAATVETLFREDNIADDAARESVKRDFEVLGSEEIRFFGTFGRFDDEFFARLLFDRVARGGARKFADRLLRRAEVVVVLFRQRVKERFDVDRFELHLLGSDLFDEFELKRADFLDILVRGHDRFEHLRFGKFASEAFDHENRFHISGNDEIEFAVFELVDRRERNEFAVDVSETHGAEGAFEGERAQLKTGGATVHRDDVGINFLIAREDVGEDLDVVVEAVGEEGTDRTVD